MEQTEERATALTDKPFELKPVPILLALLMAAGIPFLSLVTVEFAKLLVKLPERPLMPWIALCYGHAVQFGYALLAIYWLGRRRIEDFGLRRPVPNWKAYALPAVLWGLFFGALMALVDYCPQIVALKPPSDQPYPLTWFNILGWFFFTIVFAGPSNEVLFRGLLVTYLARRMPGRVSYRGYAMNGAGVVASFIYALSYSESLLTKPFSVALGQMLYALAFGVIAAYWLEKSKSLLEPVIGANVSGVVETALVFTMVAAWG